MACVMKLVHSYARYDICPEKIMMDRKIKKYFGIPRGKAACWLLSICFLLSVVSESDSIHAAVLKFTKSKYIPTKQCVKVSLYCL